MLTMWRDVFYVRFISLKPGDSDAVIDTNRLGNGVYVVVVDNG